MYLPQHWESKKSYFHSPEVEKDICKNSSFCSLSSCQQSEVLNGMGENNLPAFPGSAASPAPGHGAVITPQRVITAPAIKGWHCQSRAVFWCCVSCTSFPVWSPRRIFFFFLFERLGVQRLKYSSRWLRKVGKESNLLLPSEGWASFLCADPRWLLGLIPVPFPWQAVGIMLLFSEITGRGSSSNSGMILVVT